MFSLCFSGPDAGVIVSSSPLLSNPPYTVDIADSSEDAADKREYVNIIVSLIQKNRRAKNLPDLSLGNSPSQNIKVHSPYFRIVYFRQ